MARTQSEITRLKAKIRELGPWSQRIDFGEGVFAPCDASARRWDIIREMMELINYHGQDVLDIGTADGMWAFEAESRGAANIVGTDVRATDLERFLFARQEIGSRAIHLTGCPVQDLPDRVKIVGLPQKYDIVQHLGLFCHLRDPLLSLAKVREVLRIDGILILETPALLGDLPGMMMWSGRPGNIRFGDPSITWAPTRALLEEILVRSAFEPLYPEKWIEIGPRTTDLGGQLELGRLCLIARATNPAALHPVDQRKLRGEM